MNLFWSIFTITYAISAPLLLYGFVLSKSGKKRFQYEDTSSRIFILCLIFIPFVSQIIFEILVIKSISDSAISFFKDMIKKKERKKKIKLGIIKITPLDPYGEENWDS